MNKPIKIYNPFTKQYENMTPQYADEDMDKPTCPVCPNGIHISKPFNKEEFEKQAAKVRKTFEDSIDPLSTVNRPSQETEQGPFDTEALKGFLYEHDKEVREQERKRLREKLGETRAIDVFPTIDKNLEGSDKINFVWGVQMTVDYIRELLQDNKPEA